eukprot:gene1960-biopygen2523
MWGKCGTECGDSGFPFLAKHVGELRECDAARTLFPFNTAKIAAPTKQESGCKPWLWRCPGSVAPAADAPFDDAALAAATVAAAAVAAAAVVSPPSLPASTFVLPAPRYHGHGYHAALVRRVAARERRERDACVREEDQVRRCIAAVRSLWSPRGVLASQLRDCANAVEDMQVRARGVMIISEWIVPAPPLV